MKTCRNLIPQRVYACTPWEGFKTQPPVNRQFRPVSIVLNNDNCPEPEFNTGQPVVGF